MIRIACPRSTPRRGACPALTSSMTVSAGQARSEEHTSELQSRVDIVCRLLLEKKNTHQRNFAPSLYRSQRYYFATSSHHVTVKPKKDELAGTKWLTKLRSVAKDRSLDAAQILP